MFIVLAAVIFPANRNEVTVKVAPEALVNPPSILTLLPVVTKSVLNVPLLVIRPVKVFVPLSVLSTKLPSMVVVPATVKSPVEDILKMAPVAMDKFPEAVVLNVPVALLIKEELARIDKFPAMVELIPPPDNVRPPVPLMFNAPLQAMVLLKLMTVVASTVAPAPNVTAPPVKVPAVFAKPFVNTKLAAVVIEEDVQLPAVFVTEPENVLTPVLLASKMVPAVDVVPVTVKVAVLRFSVAPGFTVKFPASFNVNDPAPKANVPLAPPPTTIEPTVFEGEISSVTVCPSWIVTTQPEQAFCPG
jgi:hypothetical protein